MRRVNVVGTAAVIAACKATKVARLIYTSSLEVVSGYDERGVQQVLDGIDETVAIPYGAPKHPPHRIALPSPYTGSYLDAERKADPNPDAYADESSNSYTNDIPDTTADADSHDATDDSAYASSHSLPEQPSSLHSPIAESYIRTLRC